MIMTLTIMSIAALMFVEASDLIDPIRRYQARLVETPEQTHLWAKLVTSLKQPDLRAVRLFKNAK